MSASKIAALKTRAMGLLQKNALKEAETIYLELCNINPDDAESWFLLSAIYGNTGDFDAAIKCGEKATAIVPDYTDAWFNLGQAFRRKQLHSDAIDCFQRVIALQPGNTNAHLVLGTTCLDTGDLQQAIDHIKIATMQQPGNPQTWTLLGSVYAQSGQSAEALKSFREAEKLSPDSHELLYNLGLLYRKLGDSVNAEKYLGKATRLQPGDAEYFNQHGLVLKQLNKHEEAISAFQHALALKPDHEGIKFMLAALGREPTPEVAPEKYVSSLFDEFAEYFDQHLTRELEYKTPQILNAAIRALTSSKDERFDILDLGCGTGLCGPLVHDIAQELVGVDLSEKMLEKASEKHVYDQLVADDIVRYLMNSDAIFDIIIAADVFPYIGKLDQIVELCRLKLRHGGIFCFSTEAAPEPENTPPYILRDKRRYAHTEHYLNELAKTNHFKKGSFRKVDLRKDGDEIIAGYAICLVKTNDTQ